MCTYKKVPYKIFALSPKSIAPVLFMKLLRSFTELPETLDPPFFSLDSLMLLKSPNTAYGPENAFTISSSLTQYLFLLVLRGGP